MSEMRDAYKKIFVFSIIVLSFFELQSTARSNEIRVQLISTELPGGELTQKNGEVVGAYATFFKEASTRSEVPIEYRIVPWARAVKETERSTKLLLFPLTRTEARENRFTWVAPLKEDNFCFVSVGARINNLEEARKLKRVLVWRGTSHQSFLEKQDFQNLVIVNSKNKIIRILKAAHDAALYFICAQAQSYVDPGKSEISLKIGAPVASEAVWLAGSNSLERTSPIDKFVEAVNILGKSGVLKNLLKKGKK